MKIMDVKYNLVAIKETVLRSIAEFSMRGLFHTAKWLSEIVYSLKDVKLPSTKIKIACGGVSKAEYDKYLIAYSYFRDQEYDRCVFYLKNTKSPICKFLMYYGTYMALEYKKLCGTTDTNLYSMAYNCEGYLKNMLTLCNELKVAYINNQLDGFCLYVYGLVLKRLNHYEDAKDILIEAINQETLNWAAWQELSPLIPQKHWIDSIILPDHWMKDFFIGHLLVDLQLNKEAEEAYRIILNNGFEKSSYILGQVALCQHNVKDGKSAISIYNEMRKTDPFRLEGMDTFSNLLYVAETRRALAFLAHNVTEIDKYRVETSCVVGNYYSMRRDQTKAILSFQRAVKMNPFYVNAWTLLGHEYSEVKNTTAAIMCYLKAINVNKTEYRAWHGLGQSYETLRLHFFALYYYRVAQKLVPQDGRMLIALGDVYEKMDRLDETYKCYKQARNIDKHDVTAIIRLAKLLEKLCIFDQAALTYADWVNDKTDINIILSLKDEFIHACSFLTKYYVSQNDMDKAKEVANQLKRHEELEENYERTWQIITSKQKDMEANTRHNKLVDLENIRQVYPL